jgi:hypothetical protein
MGCQYSQPEGLTSILPKPSFAASTISSDSIEEKVPSMKQSKTEPSLSAQNKKSDKNKSILSFALLKRLQCTLII